MRRLPEYRLEGPGGERRFSDVRELLEAVKREAPRVGDGGEEVVRLEVEIRAEPT